MFSDVNKASQNHLTYRLVVQTEIAIVESFPNLFGRNMGRFRNLRCDIKNPEVKINKRFVVLRIPRNKEKGVHDF